MTLDTFFKTFDQFADAPDAVAKMRELVLEWAATGKLCHSASAKWKDGTLAEVIELISGQHLMADEHNADGRGIPYLTGPSDFGEKSPVPTRWTEHPKVTAQPGDILITVKGSGVGKTNVLLDVPTAISRQLMAVRVVGADPEFVHIVLKRAAKYFQDAKTGIAIPGIGRREVLDLNLVLPPLAEQKRIVAKVDELMALCDRLEAQQQERDEQASALARASLARFAEAPTPANLNLLFHKSYSIPPADLRKAIYQAAFEGVLTSQSRPSASSNGMPVGWTLLDIASLCVIEDGDRGSFYPKKTDFSGAGHCVFLNTKNVRHHGFEFATLEWISEKKHKQLRKGTLVRGDIVFTSRGTIGNIAHYDDAVPFDVMRINSGMFILRGFQKHMEASFLSRLLRSPQIRTQIDELQSGSAQPQLPIREFRKFTAKIPPLAEQHQIVGKVDQLMALVDQLETQLASSRASAKNLLEALVAELTSV